MSDPTGRNSEPSGGEPPLHLPGGEASGPERLSAGEAEAGPPPPFPRESFPPPPEPDSTSLPTPEEAVEPPALPTWERLDEEGFWVSFFLTIKEVLIQPSNTFSRMPHTANLGRPILFAVLLGFLGALISGCYGILFTSISPEAMGEMQQMAARFKEFGLPMETPTPGSLLIGTVFFVVLWPLVFLVALFIFSGITHLALILFGGVSHGYETTFRTICYVHGASAILWLIPRFGTFPISIAWAIVCSIIGLTRTQETSPAKATIAVLLPFSFCCLCIGTIYTIPLWIKGLLVGIVGV